MIDYQRVFTGIFSCFISDSASWSPWSLLNGRPIDEYRPLTVKNDVEAYVLGHVLGRVGMCVPTRGVTITLVVCILKVDSACGVTASERWQTQAF